MKKKKAIRILERQLSRLDEAQEGDGWMKQTSGTHQHLKGQLLEQKHENRRLQDRVQDLEHGLIRYPARDTVLDEVE